MADGGDNEVEHWHSSMIKNIKPIANDIGFECGDAYEKPFENLSMLAYYDQSNASNISNGTTCRTFASLNHPTVVPAVIEIIPVKSEIDGDSFVANRQIKTEPSFLDVEQSVAYNAVQSETISAKQSPASSSNGLFREHADVVDCKDDKITSPERLHFSTSQRKCQKRPFLGKNVDKLSYLSKLRAVNSKNVHRCGVCSKRFRNASVLKHHEKRHVNEIAGKTRKKRRNSIKSPFTSSKRSVRIHSCRFSSKLFPCASALQRHQDTHIGIRQKRKKYRISTTRMLRLSRQRKRLSKQNQSVGSKSSIENVSGADDYESQVNVSLSNDFESQVYVSLSNDFGSQSDVSSSNDLESRPDVNQNEIQSVDNEAVQLKCGVCNKIFNSERSLKKHKNRYHGCSQETSLRCSLCSAEFESNSSLKHHKDQYHKDDDTFLKCSFCPKSYYNKNQLLQHSKQCNKNPDVVFKCAVCLKELKSKYLLEKHEAQCQNSDASVFKCSFCPKEHESNLLLKQHERQCRSNPEAVFKCAICSKELESKYLLKKHEVLCVNSDTVTLFKCSICSKSEFESSTLLSEHENQCHKNPALMFKCSFCQSKRQTRALLKQHESQCRNNPAAAFKCTVCSKEFGSKYFLTKHEQSENHGVLREKLSKGAFACSKCSNSYSCESYLAKHKCKPYTCGQCDKSFGDEARLKNHEVIHASRHPFSCNKCGKRFTVKKSLKLHELTHSVVKPFPCVKCDKSFVQQRQLVKHQETHAYDLLSEKHRPYECAICSKRFVEKTHLNTHIWRHTNSGSFACDTCGKKYAQAASLESHMLVHTGEMPYPCPKCGKPFRVAHSLKYHMLTRHMERPYRCETCGKAFSVKSLLEKHMRALHRIKDEGMKFICTQCGKEMSSAYSLKVHESQHTGKKYPCDECDKCYSHPYSLKLHKVAHKEKPFACSLCDERFSEPSGLNQHIRQSHSEEGLGHICPKCGQSFYTQTALMKHEECHRDAQFQCTLCGARFNDLIHLKRHELKANCANRKFVCTVCAQKFASLSMLNVHMRTHTGERPFKCDQCFKSFTVEAHLKEHIESVHSLERPFQCLECPRSFPTARYLKAHARKHRIAKSFVCNLCGKSFSASCGLKQHLRMHNGERPFGCVQCSKRFIQQSGLHNHIVLVHGDKVRCSWNTFDPEPTSFDPSNTPLMSSNEINHTGENSNVKINDETKALGERTASSIDAIRASTDFEQTSGVNSSYFVSSPTNAELNEDGFKNCIDRAVPSLFPETDTADANKHPATTAVRKSKNKSEKRAKKVDTLLPCGANNDWQDVEVDVKMNSDVLNGALWKTSANPTFDPSGLSSSTCEQQAEENSGEIVKQQLIESDDETVIGDGEDRYMDRDADEDSDDYVRPSNNDLVSDSRNGTRRSSQNYVISPLSQSDASISRRSDEVQSACDVSSKRRMVSCDKVLSDDSDNTIDFNYDYSTGESHSLAEVSKTSANFEACLLKTEIFETIEPSGLATKDAQPDGGNESQLELLQSQNKSKVKEKKINVKLIQKRKRGVRKDDDEWKLNCKNASAGSESAPKRRKRCKKTVKNPSDRPPRVNSFLSYNCSHCSEILRTPRLFIEHSKEVHNDLRPFKCIQCTQEFVSVTGFKLHELRHSGARPYACTVCDKTFMQMSHLQEHTRNVHFKMRPFACTLCDKRFPLRAVLRNHERLTHRKVRKYICDQCGLGCATAQGLRIHNRLHTGECPYTCTECGMSFRQPSSIHRHMNSKHSNALPHMCVKCGKTFQTTTQRNRHELKCCGVIPAFRTSADFESSNLMRNRMFPCSKCDRIFTQRSSLKTHFLIHTGERPYPCPVCSMSFRHNSSLKDHADKKHGLIIPPKPRQINKRMMRRKKRQEELAAMPLIKRELQCSLCDKSYNIATCLRRHIRRVHEGIRPPRKKKNNADTNPYVCVECGMGLSDALSLKQHLEELHHFNNTNSNKSDM